MLSLRDEPFGQRRFGLFDPAGTWVDVVEQIDPEAGWWDKYLLPEESPARRKIQMKVAELVAGKHSLTVPSGTLEAIRCGSDAVP